MTPPSRPPPQACQAAIDQIEKRNETFKAAVQSPEGDTQEQVGETWCPAPWLPAHQLPLRSTQASSKGQGVAPTRRDVKGPGEALPPNLSLVRDSDKLPTCRPCLWGPHRRQARWGWGNLGPDFLHEL